MIKSPLNYTGGKFKLLPQIEPLFPKDIDIFVDLFAGGFNVGANISAETIVFNDNISCISELFETLQLNSLDDSVKHIETRIKEYDLSLTNKDGYNSFRDFYNRTGYPLDLFVLLAYSFNHQIRFNNNHAFNASFGRERSHFNAKMKKNLIEFTLLLKSKSIKFENLSFEEFNFSILSKDDLVYCDPPYLITTGSYNDGKRGFKGWTEKEERTLLSTLDTLDSKGIRFALSNVLHHKGKKNTMLLKWISDSNYNVNHIVADYSNSNYQGKDKKKNSSTEVLITNYN